ncbi:hypothetical protein TNCV_355851 [Trichonephila clavipes]|nr:hypothetical protein TNCV_355851 [Trichonephila clavipes]
MVDGMPASRRGSLNSCHGKTAVPNAGCPGDRASAVGLKTQNVEGEKRATRKTRFIEISSRFEEPSIGRWRIQIILKIAVETIWKRVSAADKGCRVYPLDPRPDAVALYSGCTSGKRRAWFCQMTGTLPPLLDSVVGGGTPG